MLDLSIDLFVSSVPVSHSVPDSFWSAFALQKETFYFFKRRQTPIFLPYRRDDGLEPPLAALNGPPILTGQSLGRRRLSKRRIPIGIPLCRDLTILLIRRCAFASNLPQRKLHTQIRCLGFRHRGSEVLLSVVQFAVNLSEFLASAVVEIFTVFDGIHQAFDGMRGNEDKAKVWMDTLMDIIDIQ